jgi:hypothetical protein
MSLKTILLCAGVLALSSCDDDEQQNAALQGGGPGSAAQNDVVAGAVGFCEPQGGTQALGGASWSSGVTTAKIDTDGNPLMQGHDPDWQPGTTGTVNGKGVDSSKYAYVVMSKEQLYQSGVSMGDWAIVTNSGTGQTTYARVEDKGPDGGTGEISQAAATAVGIQYASNAFTIGDPSVRVEAFAGTASIEGDCASGLATSS